MSDEFCDSEEMTVEDMAHYIKDAFYEHDYQQVIQLWYDYSDDLVRSMVDGDIGTLELAQMHEELHDLVERELRAALGALELGLEVIK